MGDTRASNGDASVPAAFGFGLELIDEVNDIEEARLEVVADVRAMPMARCVLPVPVSPMSTTLRY